MKRTDLSKECKDLELIIDNLATGKETCEIEEADCSLETVIGYLKDYLNELKALDCEIAEQGNTPELLKKVNEKYTELWLFQARFNIHSLPSVIGGLWRYPDYYE